MGNTGRATHEDFKRAHRVEGPPPRAFGVLFAVIFGVVAVWPVFSGALPRWWALALAVILALISWRRPALLAPLNALWLGLGKLMHAVVSPVILGLVFFGVITPFGWVMRLFRKDSLRLRREPEAASYWIDREPPGPAGDTLYDQF